MVQGVFFRREIVDVARRLGLTGWTRNLLDGRVEILAEGEKEKIVELIKLTHTESAILPALSSNTPHLTRCSNDDQRY